MGDFAMKPQLRKHLWFSRTVFALSLGLLFLPTGCGSSLASSASTSVSVAITPSAATVPEGGSLSFLATVKGVANTAVTWSVQGGTTPGSITSSGVYTAPNTLGTYSVVATSVADATVSATAVVTTELPTSTTAKFYGFTPLCDGAGGSALNLSVTGQGFGSGSVVRWNGTDEPTTLVNSNTLSAQIPASDIAVAGTAAITVFNPADGSLLSTSSSFTIDAGIPPASIAVDPGGKSAYVVGVGIGSCGDGFLSTYSIDPSTGLLTNVVRDMDLGDGEERFLAVDPSGKFVYVTDGNNDDIPAVLSYSTNIAPGQSTAVITAYSICGSGCNQPSWLAVNPLGTFVYVADQGGSNVFTLTAPTLTLASRTSSAGHPSSVAVDPSGKFVYVSNVDSNNVSMFSANPTSGALTSIGTIAAGTAPDSVTTDPSGKFVYVTNAGSNNVSMYSVDAATGSLTSTGPIAAGTGPASIAVDPSGRFVYVTNAGSNNISMYSINTANGTLTSIGTVAAESSPTSIAIHPSGKFIYVVNSASNSVSMYSINTSTGLLTLIGTIGT
jgi:6-phosphogluconolactonase